MRRRVGHGQESDHGWNGGRSDYPELWPVFPPRHKPSTTLLAVAGVPTAPQAPPTLLAVAGVPTAPQAPVPDYHSTDLADALT